MDFIRQEIRSYMTQVEVAIYVLTSAKSDTNKPKHDC